jgi:hypothetical protein
MSCPRRRSQRVAGDKRLQLGYEVRVAAEREVGLDALFERRQLQFVQARDLGLCERLVGEVGQGGTTPEGERPAQLLRRVLGLPLGASAPCLLEHALEAVCVDLAWLDREDVSVSAGLERPAHVRRGILVPVERPAQT